MQLKLMYFDFPFWRAEVSRLALHLGGIPFEDVRPNREAFMAMKRSGRAPYGQLLFSMSMACVSLSRSLSLDFVGRCQVFTQRSSRRPSSR